MMDAYLLTVKCITSVTDVNSKHRLTLTIGGRKIAPETALLTQTALLSGVVAIVLLYTLLSVVIANVDGSHGVWTLLSALSVMVGMFGVLACYASYRVARKKFQPLRHTCGILEERVSHRQFFTREAREAVVWSAKIIGDLGASVWSRSVAVGIISIITSAIAIAYGPEGMSAAPWLYLSLVPFLMLIMWLCNKERRINTEWDCLSTLMYEGGSDWGVMAHFPSNDPADKRGISFCLRGAQGAPFPSSACIAGFSDEEADESADGVIDRISGRKREQWRSIVDPD